jgi:oxygen-independent coproporphyrinogen-3 oxidase
MPAESPRHVYVHVPFCARRCAYCDFAIAVRRDVPGAEFLAALGTEVELRFPHPEVRPVDTIYLGGGTPSRLGGDGIARLMHVLARRWIPAPGAEVTLEANPEDVSSDAVAAWMQAGVTRISLGVQSFDDAVLRWMHRTHDARQAGIAAGALEAAGLDWSIDLIFGLPREVEREWTRDRLTCPATASPWRRTRH